MYIETATKRDRMKDLFRESVLSGDLQPGDRLLSEPELIRKYRVSRGTIREAVASLVHEGLLYRIQGKGTFVSDRPPPRPTIAVALPYLFFNESAAFSAGTDVIPRLVQAIEAEARRLGMSILLSLANHEPRIERENISHLIDRKVDGVLLYYVGVQENLDCLTLIREAGVPLVMIDRYVEYGEGSSAVVDGNQVEEGQTGRARQDYVVTDNARGAYQATNHLLNQGFDHILYVTSPLVDTTLRDRYAGYSQALVESGSPPHVLYLDVEAARYQSEESRAYRQARDAIKSIGSAPFAVLTADAPILVGVWQAIAQERIAPDRYALACFDDPFLSLPAGVRLMKILQPVQEIGRVSVEIMQQKLLAKTLGKDMPAGRQVRLEPEWVIADTGA